MSEETVIHRLIIPPHEAERLVARGPVYLRDCPCRAKAANCPPEAWQVCLLFEHAAPEMRQPARLISNAEAARVIRAASQRGEIHQVFYEAESGRLSELCNCCACCCSPLRRAREQADGYAGQLHSGYVAVTAADACTACGACLEACFFEARRIEDGQLHLVDELCFGCGVCIPRCPTQAIRLEYHSGRGVPLPQPNL